MNEYGARFFLGDVEQIGDRSQVFTRRKQLKLRSADAEVAGTIMTNCISLTSCGNNARNGAPLEQKTHCNPE